MCIYSPMPHTLSYCALIGKCALIRSNTVAWLIPLKEYQSPYLIFFDFRYIKKHFQLFSFLLPQYKKEQVILNLIKAEESSWAVTLSKSGLEQEP